MGRVATYLTTSIDGGQTFAPDVYANPQDTATDAITGDTDLIGPQPDNQSSGDNGNGVNGVDEFGYGTRMGLAVFDGKVYPVWSGNFNLSAGQALPTQPRLLDIYTNVMTIAAGPRIVSSTMGKIAVGDARQHGRRAGRLAPAGQLGSDVRSAD